ncbi:MAG TPA: hypothetical protein VGA21_02050 [Cyclobacteriaceae bacterium]|jgi:hypothetical protein
MTNEEKIKIRNIISSAFVELGRIKQILATKGHNYEYPESVFLKEPEMDNQNILIYEIDGLNQLWQASEIMRDKMEDVLALEHSDFLQVSQFIESNWKFIFEGLKKIEKSLNAKQI